MRHKYYIYIVTNRSKMIYVGLTNDLKNILKKHREMRMKCPKGNFGLKKLVHVEQYYDVSQAVKREAELKEAPRDFKQKLLDFSNPGWDCIQEYWKENMERSLVKVS